MPRRGTPAPAYNHRDRYETPDYAIDLVRPYIPAGLHIWESACGSGRMVRHFQRHGYGVSYSDLILGQDYFAMEPFGGYDIQVTNPPYSECERWIETAYKRGKPFALLMPTLQLTNAGTGALFNQYGIQVIIPNIRIRYLAVKHTMKEDNPRMHTSWFMWGLNLPRDLMFVTCKHSDQSADFLEPERDLPLLELLNYA